MKVNKRLVEALEKLLLIAEAKLQYAIEKNKEWDIQHYTQDIEKIKNELKIVKYESNI
jgi:hypothetical protein